MCGTVVNCIIAFKRLILKCITNQNIEIKLLPDQCIFSFLCTHGQMTLHLSALTHGSSPSSYGDDM